MGSGPMLTQLISMMISGLVVYVLMRIKISRIKADLVNSYRDGFDAGYLKGLFESETITEAASRITKQGDSRP